MSFCPLLYLNAAPFLRPPGFANIGTHRSFYTQVKKVLSAFSAVAVDVWILAVFRRIRQAENMLANQLNPNVPTRDLQGLAFWHRPYPCIRCIACGLCSG